MAEGRTWLNRTGNPGMAVGGTGDILAGICTGLIAQGFSLAQAARAGTWLCGRIGDSLKHRLGYGFIASDFLPEIARHAKALNTSKYRNMGL